MKIVIRLFLLAAVVALGWWLWTVFFPSPERVVLKRMQSLAELLTFKSDISNLGRESRASEFTGYFSVDTEIVVDVPELGAHTLSGRDEVREAGNGGFASAPSLSVSFLDATVKIGPDKQTADVSCTLKASAGNDKDYGVQELRFQWKKIEGTWQITRAETVKTLR
ncbi:MAG TPA: hypothetical protein VK742_02035 [Candidatus Sulfotelmatobacter sp.]|jgi:hypothetical protein|nr:hypothetical protein [Candidatus Sulfotelmatobacter sp.]